MSSTPYERSLRPPPRVGRVHVLEWTAFAVLERALAHLEGGTLEVRLPGGGERRFGSGPPVSMEIHDARFFRRVATRGKVGLGESYTAGEWDSDDPVALFELLLRNAAAAARRHQVVRRLLEARPRLSRRNGLLGARRNIAYHYDLGNELFGLMLDETMTYSCAVFERHGQPLADAQRTKYRRVCDKLGLGPHDRVLEIGCGWGGFARFAAEEHGCSVTGLTISAEQAALARDRTAGLDVRILEQDYRLHEGSYTKVASIEMLEAIGERQFPTYFETIDRLLEPGGVACIQTILVPEERWDRYRKTPDWIERYVFPGCLIPSLGALSRALAGSELELRDVDEIGPHYAETLRRWRTSFHERIAEVRELGHGPRFERTWDFYLAFCEAAFRTGTLRDAQLTLARAEA
ncbi:MAG TPA: cyclopropane-fatty-acyl-phospholipid synthase family protein [Gaiellaceae bacterium]|nr:cyclopropane-fatty-acyl-phospholipid synthase family protein [Gaiellaceae bacterium]